jgi:hypothetical protein
MGDSPGEPVPEIEIDPLPHLNIERLSEGVVLYLMSPNGGSKFES